MMDQPETCPRMHRAAHWRVHFALLMAALFFSSAILAATGPATEVVVIGTAHQPGPFFTHDTLSEILQQQNAQVLLMEGDRSDFDKEGGLGKDLVVRLGKELASSVEGPAVVKYEQVSGVRAQPFDIEGRNRFFQEKDYFRKQAALLAKISSLYEENKLSPEAAGLIETLSAFSQIIDKFALDRPEVFNSAASDAVVERDHQYLYDGIRKIVALTPALKDFSSFWSETSEFWIRRNDAMVQNILGYVKQNPGKRIVVICGFEHRYYLRRELAKQEKSLGFVQREYWAQDAQRTIR